MNDGHGNCTQIGHSHITHSESEKNFLHNEQLRILCSTIQPTSSSILPPPAAYHPHKGIHYKVDQRSPSSTTADVCRTIFLSSFSIIISKSSDDGQEEKAQLYKPRAIRFLSSTFIHSVITTGLQLSPVQSM